MSSVLGPLRVQVREPLSHAERGRMGARARWRDHRPRTLRLDKLDPLTRRAVEALVAAAESAPASETV